MVDTGGVGYALGINIDYYKWNFMSSTLQLLPLPPVPAMTTGIDFASIPGSDQRRLL
jgi:hypothetical protein